MAPAPFLRRALVVAEAALTLLTASCATTHQWPAGHHRSPVLVERDNANGTTVRVEVGRRIAVILSSSYWTFRASSAPAIVRQDGPVTYLAAPPGGCVPGGGCNPVRASFIALKPGRAVITANRLSCGEALLCAPSQRHFHLTLLVQ